MGAFSSVWQRSIELFFTATHPKDVFAYSLLRFYWLAWAIGILNGSRQTLKNLVTWHYLLVPIEAKWWPFDSRGQQCPVFWPGNGFTLANENIVPTDNQSISIYSGENQTDRPSYLISYLVNPKALLHTHWKISTDQSTVGELNWSLLSTCNG